MLMFYLDLNKIDSIAIVDHENPSVDTLLYSVDRFLRYCLELYFYNGAANLHIQT